MHARVEVPDPVEPKTRKERHCGRLSDPLNHAMSGPGGAWSASAGSGADPGRGSIVLVVELYFPHMKRWSMPCQCQSLTRSCTDRLHSGVEFTWK
eukprot:125695-Rhodomonas_salina.2